MQAPKLKLTSSTSSQKSSDSTEEDTSPYHECFMATKVGQLLSYAIELENGKLRVLSVKSDKTKLEVEVDSFHIRKVKKVLRSTSDENSSGKSASDSSTFAGLVASQDKVQYWYPLKMNLPEHKSRMVHFASSSLRKRALSNILAAQGFKNQLDQYEVLSTIEAGSANPVYIAQHRITGAKVVIKDIPTSNYRRLSKENKISEASAMELCQGSPNVARLVESFSYGKKTYLVTSLVEGGDLLGYLSSKDVNRLPEAEARTIFS